jgi:hypothetical protein
MRPRIAITHGFHPNEFTEPYAMGTAEALRDMGYDVSVHEVPHGLTCWGVALAGFPQRIVMEACGGYHMPPCEHEVILDFHAQDESLSNRRKLPAKNLRFMLQGDLDTAGWSGITYQPWWARDPDAPHINGYWIEVPQRYRPTPAKFTRAVLKANPRFERQMLFTRYFSREADRQETLHRYPHYIIAQTIALGIEELILPNLMPKAAAVS